MSELTIVSNSSEIVISPTVTEITIAPVGVQGLKGDPGDAGNPAYERAFTQADLSIADILAVAHGLNTYPSGICVYDEIGALIEPDDVFIVSVNAIATDLKSFAPLNGTWTISITP